MAQKRNALGRGLDALLSMDEVQTEGSSSINEIELSKIAVNPNQPRREFDPTALQELAESIAEIGIIQPITLRKLSDDEYQIIAGERRFRASQIAGLTSIPALPPPTTITFMPSRSMYIGKYAISYLLRIFYKSSHILTVKAA